VEGSYCTATVDATDITTGEMFTEFRYLNYRHI